MAFEVVFVIRLPRSRTHIAKVFATGTVHVVAAHRPLDCFFAPRTHLCVCGYPFCVGLLGHHLLHPLCFLLAFAGVMVVALAFEAEDFATGATDSPDTDLVDTDAIATVSAGAELVVTVLEDEKLAYFFTIFLFQGVLVA